MNEPVNESRLEKIRKLMTIADDPRTSDVEAETFRQKAAELIMKWEIDEALLAQDNRLFTDKIQTVYFEVPGPKGFAYEMVTLGAGMADAMGMRGVLNKRAERANLLVIGFSADIERFKILYDLIATQAILAKATWYKANVRDWWTPSNKYNAKRSFLIGFATTIMQRFLAARTHVVEEAGEGTALVLFDRSKRVDDFASTNFNLVNKRSQKRYGDGMYEGMRAGAQADIGQTGVRDGGSRELTKE